MNRRNFIRNILVGGASFAILPGAGRVWKAMRVVPKPYIELVTTLETASMLFNPADYAGSWHFVWAGEDLTRGGGLHLVKRL